jgi:enamine deaminase RidA (YjgF/YER057c/UK114 family)
MLHIFVGCTAEDARPGSTGCVVPGYRAIVVDERGRELPRNTVGRLAVIGPTGCRYLDDTANQQMYVQHGWNLTGDAYLVDDEGYFWYQARTDDMIISSGYNISGPEVENVLMTHPAVAECAVIGAPDAARGQIVQAFVVLAPEIEPDESLTRTLQAFVKGQLAPYKYPRAIKYVSSLPRTLTGKLQRFKLREEARQEAGEKSANKACASSADAPPLAFHEPGGWTKPIGYSNAVSAAGRVLFVAGQVGWNPITARFETTDLCGQIRQALSNVVAALAAGGARPEQLTRLTWYLTDREQYLSQRTAIGDIYREVVGRHFPAMSVVIVQRLLEPDALVEIEATAVVSSRM